MESTYATIRRTVWPIKHRTERTFHLIAFAFSAPLLSRFSNSSHIFLTSLLLHQLLHVRSHKLQLLDFTFSHCSASTGTQRKQPQLQLAQWRKRRHQALRSQPACECLKLAVRHSWAVGLLANPAVSISFHPVMYPSGTMSYRTCLFKFPTNSPSRISRASSLWPTSSKASVAS